MKSINEDEPGLLSARETAARLGVKRDTLYAYVSRGLLRSVRLPGSRERGYRAEDVERFAPEATPSAGAASRMRRWFRSSTRRSA